MTKIRPSILIADDNEYLAELVQARFEAERWRCRSVKSGAMVESALVAEPVKLLLLDIEMPGMNGIEVLRTLKANPATAATDVIMLTGRRSEGDVAQALQLGAADYIVKPFDVEELVRRIARRMEFGERGAN